MRTYMKKTCKKQTRIGDNENTINNTTTKENISGKITTKNTENFMEKKD